MLRVLSIFLYLLGGIYFVIFGIYVIIFSTLFGHKRIQPTLPLLTRLQLLFLGAWVRRKNKIPKKGQYIIMMNHSSFADIFFSVQPLRGKYTAIIASFNFRIPIWNKMLKSFKAIPVYRKNKAKAIEAIKQAEHLINNLGYHVVIFPEGTRTQNGELQSFKKGGFHMAINTQTPIIPIIVKGGFRFKPKHRWYIKPSIIDIKVGEPIDVKDYSISDVNLLLNKTHSIFKDLLK
jgi:1-acyl-sn-glycerol-3-phosphate acyltransferase